MEDTLYPYGHLYKERQSITLANSQDDERWKKYYYNAFAQFLVFWTFLLMDELDFNNIELLCQKTTLYTHQNNIR